MKLLLSVVLAFSGTAALPAHAQFTRPEDAIKYRKAAFTVMAIHFGRVASMANGRSPYDAKSVVDNAQIVSLMAALPFSAFVDGSERGGDTHAQPKIWLERGKFDAAAGAMGDEVAKLSAAAKAGDPAAVKSAAGGVARACKACHDTYRKD